MLLHKPNVIAQFRIKFSTDYFCNGDYLPGDNSNFGDCGFSESVQKLGSMPNDTSVLLRRTRQKSGYIDKGYYRDVESVAEPDESRTFD